jgi:hypothetical protein
MTDVAKFAIRNMTVVFGKIGNAVVRSPIGTTRMTIAADRHAARRMRTVGTRLNLDRAARPMGGMSTIGMIADRRVGHATMRTTIGGRAAPTRGTAGDAMTTMRIVASGPRIRSGTSTDVSSPKTTIADTAVHATMIVDMTEMIAVIAET